MRQATSGLKKKMAARLGGVRYMACAGALVAMAGMPAQGQLGTEVSWGDPDAFSNAPGGTFKQVSGGLTYCLGLRYDGEIKAWGSPLDFRILINIPVNNPQNPFVAVAAGRTHALALRQDGTVFGWGDDAPTAQPATDPPAGVLFKAIAAGENFSMGIVSSNDPNEDDTLRLWGWNYAFQKPDLNPPPLYSGKVRAIAAGGHHAILIKDDETLHAWGEHNAPQYAFGQGSVPVALQNVQAWAVAAGHFHNVVLAMDGRVYAWGWNENGQAESQPANVRFREIAAGYATSFAVRHNGEVVVWGYNPYNLHTVPQVIPEPGMIAAGYYHAMAVRGCYGDCNRDLQYDSNDHDCFVYRYSIGDPWANCDGSTVEPILNVDDYTCFINRYAVCTNQ